jgi:hypothetical protein
MRRKLTAFLEYRVQFGRYELNLVTLVWLMAALIIALIRISGGAGGMNNYLLFEGIIRHMGQGQNIYWDYWWEYDDANHYGPAFSLVIAPFAILHPLAGCFLWCMANATILLFAVRRLPLSHLQQSGILALSLTEMTTSLSNVQFNPMLTAWFLLAWVLVHEGKDFKAMFYVAMGFLVKLYGIAGLAFFSFSRKRSMLIVGFVFWFLVGFAGPMVFSSPEFVLQTYADWFESLQIKHAKNLNLGDTDLSQDISAPGLMRRMFGLAEFKDIWMLAPAALILAIPLVRMVIRPASRESHILLLSLVLISVVIFSSSAESATYIIAVTGCALWYVTRPNPLSPLPLTLMASVLVLSSFSSTDLFPPAIRRDIIWPYAVKALPVTLCWMVIAWQFWREVFLRKNI